jgi:hypothetical protein
MKDARFMDGVDEVVEASFSEHPHSPMSTPIALSIVLREVSSACWPVSLIAFHPSARRFIGSPLFVSTPLPMNTRRGLGKHFRGCSGGLVDTPATTRCPHVVSVEATNVPNVAVVLA